MRKHDNSVRPRILIADETRDLADVYGFLFTAAGYRVLRAYDGLTASAFAKVLKPDIAILNNYLPGLTGLALLQDLRAAGSATKVIITSSLDDFAALAARARSEGAEFCVRQPCPADRLLRMVAALRSTSARGR
jgi:DNA-binding response OmpR family regulator